MDRTLQARLDSDPLLQQAAEWFFELRADDVAPERIAEWQEWLAVDAAHRAAFDGIESFWIASAGISTAPWPSDSEVASDSYRGQESVSRWRQASARNTVRRRSMWPALAASVVVVAILGSWLVLRTPALAVQTTVGETRRLSLPDGSTVALGGHSAMEARFSERLREIVLERGEAFFKVAKDAARPFVVHVGTTDVTAIGTAFNVRRTNDDSVVVSVSEGEVRISDANRIAASLNAGHQARVPLHASEMDVAAVAPASIAGWRDGRLQYMNEPLGDVVADLARYSARQIIIVDESVAQLRITSVVFEQNVDGWLAGIEATLPVQVVREKDGTVELRARNR